ncbi:MAG TPA: CbiX/SirB N-terminal domain-containing protein [Micromonosporaceae bacterium]
MPRVGYPAGHRRPVAGARQPWLLLAAHGSRDPASAVTMRALAARVGRVWPAPVVATFLDFNEPSIGDALAWPPEGETPIVVPALLTHAYHGRVDLPAVLAASRPVALAPVLGPDPLLLAALRRRLSSWPGHPDAIVLIAAGTSDALARSTVDAAAAQLGRALGVSCVAGYASSPGPSPGEAVLALRRAGARRVLAASYFLAPGRLYGAAARSALEADAVGVAPPLGAADEVVRLVVARARTAIRAGRVPAAV